MVQHTHVDKSIPSLPKIAISYDTDGFPQLALDHRRDSYHEPNELALDRNNFVLRKLVTSIFVLRKDQQRPNTPIDGLFTVQFRLMKFLKNRALDKRVVLG